MLAQQRVMSCLQLPSKVHHRVLSKSEAEVHTPLVKKLKKKTSWFKLELEVSSHKLAAQNNEILVLLHNSQFNFFNCATRKKLRK